MLMKCVECETEPMFKANLIKEAANVIKAEDPDRYIKLASEAIDMYAIAGRSSGAAGLSKDCAENANIVPTFPQIDRNPLLWPRCPTKDRIRNVFR